MPIGIEAGSQRIAGNGIADVRRALTWPRWRRGPRPEGQRFQCLAWMLVSVMEGVFAAARLRNSAARAKISPMVWPAS
jgi:hypothetical protein